MGIEPFPVDTVQYIGRFAPSPTGPLHFGSLIAAVASYLDAKYHRGKWLLRIDDIDEQRCDSAHSNTILHSLESFGLHWDDAVVYQQSQHHRYQQALDALTEDKLTYRCTCSRKSLPHGPYPGTCRNKQHAANRRSSIRILTPDEPISLNDGIQGEYSQQLQKDVGDFVICRSDQIFSYHLVSVVDDALSGVDQIVRGSDLLDSTPRQIYLQQLLKLPTPSYSHIPIAVNQDGNKLSKQTYAEAIDLQKCAQLLYQVLIFLNQEVVDTLTEGTPEEILDWGIEHWDKEQIPKVMAIPYDSS